MSSRSVGKGRTRPEMVNVVVVVSHDQLRRGETGEVELTGDVRQRLDRGYLRLADVRDPDPAAVPRPLGGVPVPAPVTLLGVTPGGPVAVPPAAGGRSAGVAGGPDDGTD